MSDRSSNLNGSQPLPSSTSAPSTPKTPDPSLSTRTEDIASAVELTNLVTSLLSGGDPIRERFAELILMYELALERSQEPLSPDLQRWRRKFLSTTSLLLTDLEEIVSNGSTSGESGTDPPSNTRSGTPAGGSAFPFPWNTPLPQRS